MFWPGVALRPAADRRDRADAGGVGSSTIQQIVSQQVGLYAQRVGVSSSQAVTVETRLAFNQSLNSDWFSGTMALINNITMLAILLAGAALVREREHWTLEHLLVMPVRPVEIMVSKLAANGLVILVMTLFAIVTVLVKVLGMHITGSLTLYMAGVALYLFFVTSFGLFLGRWPAACRNWRCCSSSPLYR